ncbi:MAG TPA: ribonucleotide-diphosphate reductase subunit beta [Actinomycetota bacterium]|nr:ribonucleotide-diphosphate reductase subunit beta [Actinomycetota bacterium]
MDPDLGAAPPEVARVEDAELNELRGVDIDDVYLQMDWLLSARPTPMDLYHRWERQNWATQDLDFSEDAVQWKQMTGFFEGVRTELQRSFTLFFVGEQAVTDTLSPLVHAAPDEGSRIFLATQLVDEARHAVFFSRFFDEVIGISGGLSEAVGMLKSRVVGEFKTIFDTDLVQATEAVRKDPNDYGAWIEGITVYHLIVEGMLALTGQKFILGIIRELGILPGFYTGFTAVARDESRHVNFGVRAIMEAGIRDPASLRRVEAVIMRLLEPACKIVASPDRKIAVSIDESPPNLRINPYEVKSFSLHSLTKRLRVAGISSDFCDEVTRLGNSYYDDAWAEYEDIHGEEHPRRFFDRMTATTG